MKIVWDNRDGIGSIPFGEDAENEGRIIMMTPDEFLSAVKPKSEQAITQAVRDAVEQGKSMGMPMLFIGYNKEYKTFYVAGHEGRNRATLIKELGIKHLPVTVHLWSSAEAELPTRDKKTIQNYDIENERSTGKFKIKFTKWSSTFKKFMETFEPKISYHSTLNPKIWEFGDETADVLKSEVKEHLTLIASAFAVALKVPADAIKDIVFTGSNCNYNWTDLSDIDVHLEIVEEQLNGCPDCSINLEDCIQAKKTLWNEQHDITIYGIQVEAYATTKLGGVVGSAGAYSLKFDQWIQLPKKENVTWSSDAIAQKGDEIAKEIDQLVSGKADVSALREMNDKLSRMRQSGLETGGEFSLENLVFKALRNNGFVQKLRHAIVTSIDDSLSLREAFDTKIDYKIEKNTADVFVTSAVISDRKIEVWFEKEDRGSEVTWSTVFVEVAPGSKATDVKSNNKTFSITGSRGEFKVFAMVKRSMIEFIERYHPDAIFFSAHKSDGSRASLYAKMLKKLNLPKYKVEAKDKGTSTVFTLRRD